MLEISQELGAAVLYFRLHSWEINIVLIATVRNKLAFESVRIWIQMVQFSEIRIFKYTDKNQCLS